MSFSRALHLTKYLLLWLHQCFWNPCYGPNCNGCKQTWFPRNFPQNARSGLNVCIASAYANTASAIRRVLWRSFEAVSQCLLLKCWCSSGGRRRPRWYLAGPLSPSNRPHPFLRKLWKRKQETPLQNLERVTWHFRGDSAFADRSFVRLGFVVLGRFVERRTRYWIFGQNSGDSVFFKCDLFCYRQKYQSYV